MDVLFLDLDEKQVQEIKANIESLEKLVSLPSAMESKVGDFFEGELDILKGRKVLLPLNPPYGIRLSHDDQSAAGFYSQLAKRVLELGHVCSQLDGFCLIPDDKAYKAMRQLIGAGYQGTAHINQGGRHIRALYFSL